MRANVELGAKLLDNKIPDWAKVIDLTSLNMSNQTDCVSGQLAEYLKLSIDDYFKTLGLTWDLWCNGDSAKYGFGTYGSYSQLTELWREQIMVRTSPKVKKTIFLVYNKNEETCWEFATLQEAVKAGKENIGYDADEVYVAKVVKILKNVVAEEDL